MERLRHMAKDKAKNRQQSQKTGNRLRRETTAQKSSKESGTVAVMLQTQNFNTLR